MPSKHHHNNDTHPNPRSHTDTAQLQPRHMSEQWATELGSALNLRCPALSTLRASLTSSNLSPLLARIGGRLPIKCLDLSCMCIGPSGSVDDLHGTIKAMHNSLEVLRVPLTASAAFSETIQCLPKLRELRFHKPEHGVQLSSSSLERVHCSFTNTTDELEALLCSDFPALETLEVRLFAITSKGSAVQRAVADASHPTLLHATITINQIMVGSDGWPTLDVLVAFLQSTFERAPLRNVDVKKICLGGVPIHAEDMAELLEHCPGVQGTLICHICAGIYMYMADECHPQPALSVLSQLPLTAHKKVLHWIGIESSTHTGIPTFSPLSCRAGVCELLPQQIPFARHRRTIAPSQAHLLQTLQILAP